MAKVRDLQTNFQAGEIAPAMRMRVDAGFYKAGAASLTNYELLAGGGARRRPGTAYLATIASPTAAHQQEVFFRGTGDAYILIFQNTTLKIYSRTGSLVQTLTSQAWTTAMMGYLSVAQDGDVMVIAHADLQTKTLTYSGGTFAVANFAFREGASSTVPKKQPYRKFVDKTVTLTPSAYSGAGITLTASAASFTSDHVGTILRYGGGEISVTGYTNSTTLTGTCRETLPKAWSVPVESSLGFLVGAPVVSTLGDNAGIIYSIIDATHIGVHMTDRSLPFGYDASVYAMIQSGSTTSKLTAAPTVVATPPASPAWDEQAFSTVRGWPHTVTFQDQRLVFGYTDSLPRTVWGSRIGDYYDFQLGEALSADAFEFDMANDQSGNIIHLLGGDELLIFSDQGEYRLPQSDGTTLTPETLTLRRQSKFGIGTVKPRIFDGVAIFVQKGGALVRDLEYDDRAKGYMSNSLSLAASHLLNSPVDMDVRPSADREEQYAYIVNADGTLAQMHGLRAEKILGWTPWETNGLFKTVRVVDGEVFVTVVRTINGTAKLFLERVDYDLSLDCAVSFSTAATATRTVAHLPAETVHCVNGTLYYGDALADGSGVAVFDETSTDCHVGLNYEATLTTLPPVIESGGGALIGKPMRFGRIQVYLLESVTFEIDGFTLAVRQVNDDMSVDPTAKTGLYEFFLLGWAKAPQITIAQAMPLPLTVLGIIAEVAL